MYDQPLKYGLRLKTCRSLVQLEEWLDVYCPGEWSLVLLNMDDMMEQKEIELRFQNREDKSSFVDYYKGNYSTYAKPAAVEDSQVSSS